MKRIFSILFALVLVLSFSLIPAVPASADTEVTVTVLQHDGADTPVQGARVWLWKDSVFQGSLYTDTNGEVSWSLSDGSYGIEIHKDPGVRTERYNFAVPSEIEITVYLTWVTVSVLQHDEEGSPVENARVRLWKDGGYKGSLYTDTNGEVSWWLPDGSYEVKVQKEGEPGVLSYAHNFAVPSTTETTVYLTWVTVHVEQSGSSPVEGVQVYLYNKNHGYHGSLNTDENGEVSWWLPDFGYYVKFNAGSGWCFSPIFDVPPVTSATVNLDECSWELGILIDITPKSINLKRVPERLKVVIFGGYAINPEDEDFEFQFNGEPIDAWLATRGSGEPWYSYADVNSDGTLDLVAFFNIDWNGLAELDKGAYTVTLTVDAVLKGTDSVTIQ